MPFPRQRPDGTNETYPLMLSPNFNGAADSPQPASISNRIASYLPGGVLQSPIAKNVIAGAVLLSSAGLLCQMPANAGNKDNLPGVWGWTTGSQTYFRARPSALTPAVAKVPSHTKVFVWGKFDGWYRVESVDHKFGWVFNDYISCPKSEKIKELSHRKAKLASDRTENQTMYGSPALLQRHYAKYKAPGAVRGLAQQGVRLVSAHAKPKPKAVPVKVATHRAPAKTVVAKNPQPNAKPVVWTTNQGAKPVSHRAPAQKFFPKTRASATPDLDFAARVESQQPAKSGIEMEQAPLRVAEAAPVQNSNPVENPNNVVVVAPSEAPSTSRISPAAPREILEQPVVEKKPALKAVAKPRPVAVKAAAKPAPRVAQQAARPHRLSSREIRQIHRAAARQKLRARLGSNVMAKPATVVPPLATGKLRPLTPAELMQARDAYLSSQKNNYQSPSAATTASEADKDGSRPSNGNQEQESAVITPSSSNWNLADDAQAYLKLDLKSSRPGTDVVPIAQVVKIHGKGAPNRGGSPRDYARQNNAFGQSMANQALGYRGMPYIRGAESPNRGFDCSGLIYYLLRQRGYNPPRTAAELASYGKSVPRNQLQAGDILLFANTYHRGVSHVGIYLGNNKFVHAANASKGVRVDSLSSSYYTRKYYGARRVK